MLAQELEPVGLAMSIAKKVLFSLDEREQVEKNGRRFSFLTPLLILA
jgi:hypothetical protein